MDGGVWMKIPWLDTLWQDLRYGARLLRANPGFTAVAILSLALGIGANTAIFQLLDAVRMRSLPVQDPQDLAFIRIADRNWASGSFNGYYSQLTNPMWEQIRQQQQGFSGVFAFGGERLNLARGGEAKNAEVMWVSGGFFNVLGVPPLLGRVFTQADDQRGCSTAGAVISYSFWQRSYGGDPSAIGKTLTLESHPFEIVGVTPANFHGIDVGKSYDVAIPICVEPVLRGEYSYLDKRNYWWLSAGGRLKPGMPLERATAQLQAISAAVFQATLPPQYGPEGIKHFLAYKLGAFPAANGVSQLRKQYESPLWLLLGIAGLVLLIACANLANLILARASAREREISVRLALGASRPRLIRQLLAESMLLAVLGALGGVLLAQFVSRFLIRLITTEGHTIVVNLGLDWRLLGFTAALAMLTCILFGLTPALRATRMSPALVMNASGRGLTATRERFGVRRVLVITQIALSLVLVAGALLFVFSLRNLLSVDAGFNQTGVMVVDVDFSKLKIPKEQRFDYKRQLLDRLRGVPGVESAATVSIVPMSGNGWNQQVVLDGQKKGDSLMNRVSPGYFKTMGTPLLAGRDFGDQDTPNSPKTAIVNELFAKKYIGGNPIGKTFHIDVGVGEPDPAIEIVGIVRDSKYYDLRSDFEPTAFFPEAQDRQPDEFTDVVVRSSMSGSALMGALRHGFEEISPAISIEFHVLTTWIRDGMLKERLMATLSGFFGLLAGVLATIGLYGVISYMVARRTSEIGIRMALGATPANVLSMVLREAMRLLLIGVAVGTLLAAAAAQTAKALLYGLKPYDPFTLAVAVLTLGVVAIAASFLPARRAAGLEPMAALREE